jgi:hypothetical protein
MRIVHGTLFLPNVSELAYAHYLAHFRAFTFFPFPYIEYVLKTE